MKCISLWEPWAALIAIGAKRVETRSWPTDFRGPIAIHAAKRWTMEQRKLIESEPFKSVLEAAGYQLRPHNLPLGAVVAVAHVVKMGRTEDIRARVSEQERAFGDYRPGRWGWALAGVKKLARPLPYTGAQGWFQVPDELLVAAMLPEAPPVPDGQQVLWTGDPKVRLY